jgi:beta-lactamase class D
MFVFILLIWAVCAMIMVITDESQANEYFLPSNSYWNHSSGTAYYYPGDTFKIYGWLLNYSSGIIANYGGQLYNYSTSFNNYSGGTLNNSGYWQQYSYNQYSYIDGYLRNYNRLNNYCLVNHQVSDRDGVVLSWHPRQ